LFIETTAAAANVFAARYARLYAEFATAYHAYSRISGRRADTNHKTALRQRGIRHQVSVKLINDLNK
jgi:hypothetical protein